MSYVDQRKASSLWIGRGLPLLLTLIFVLSLYYLLSPSEDETARAVFDSRGFFHPGMKDFLEWSIFSLSVWLMDWLRYHFTALSPFLYLSLGLAYGMSD